MSAKDDAQEIVSLVDRVRCTKRPENRVDQRLLASLDSRLKERNSALFIECRRQLEIYRRSPEDSLFVAHVPLGGDKFLLISFLKVPKAPNSHFEAMIYRRVRVNDAVKEHVPSAAYPIEIEMCTRGLLSAQMLGFFGENVGYGGDAQINHPDVPAVYLVDRFGCRFEQYTKPSISIGTCSNTFQRLKSIPNPPTSVWASVWLMCHEYLHNNETDMPYQDDAHRVAKSSLFGAAFEETRVDVKSILHLRDQLDSLTDGVIAEYILAERLLAYPLVDLHRKASKPTFDTVGAVYLLVKMISLGFLSIAEGKLSLANDWISGIRQISDQMADVEHWLLLQPAELRQGCLRRHVLEVVTGSSIAFERKPMDGGFLLPGFYYQLYNSLFSSNSGIGDLRQPLGVNSATLS